jgi:hypothetical protein
MDLLAAPRAWEAMNAGSRHQQFDRAVTGLATSADGEFAMIPAGAVGPARCSMNLDDLIGQPRMTDRALRWWSRQPRVVAVLRHSHDAARPFDCRALSHHHSDCGELPFGGTTALINSFARRCRPSLRPPQPTCRLRSDRSRDGATPAQLRGIATRHSCSSSTGV